MGTQLLMPNLSGVAIFSEKGRREENSHETKKYSLLSFFFLPAEFLVFLLASERMVSSL